MADFLEPIPADYAKRGPAALVEVAVQEAIDERSRADELLTTLNSDLKQLPGNRNEAVRNFEVARYYSQAVRSLISFAILADAFPRINEWHEQHRTFGGSHDTGDPIPIGHRWLSESTNVVLGRLKEKRRSPDETFR